MNRKINYLRVLVGVLVFLMAAPPWTMAQGSGTGATFRQEELDQMLAPIALYPDSLLGQILVAATYPDQVIDADQWLGQNKNFQGDQLNAALDDKDWDLSVKALVPFPQVLSMMSDKKDWTQRMGDAFQSQQADVMDTIQSLRGKAHAQGNLKDTDQQRVVVRGSSIEIEPANPRIIYVPTYNPVVIYGPWWHPAYLPYAYNPYYPGYAYDPYYTGSGFIVGGVFGFAAGIAVGSVWNSGWGRWDWGRRDVNININRTVNINRNDIRRTDIRTSSFRNVNRQAGVNRQGGALRSTRGAAGQSGNRRTTGEATLNQRVRPTAGSVQQGLQQRERNTQVRQGRNAEQRNQPRIGSDRSQTGRSGVSGQSNGQVNRARSSGKSDAQMGRAQPSERAGGQMGRAQQSGQARGVSLRNGGPSPRGGNPQGGSAVRGGGNPKGGGGAGHDDKSNAKHN